MLVNGIAPFTFFRFFMKQVYFATMNKGKLVHINHVLNRFDIEAVQLATFISEPRTDDLKEIAKEKVIQAFNKSKKPCIAIDSGFFVDSLNGFPRTFANFALETIGTKGILKMIEGETRTASFRHCLAYLDETLSEPIYFESRLNGIIPEKERGEEHNWNWSKLSFIFVPNGLEKTIAEMNEDEFKNFQENPDNDRFMYDFSEWFAKK